MCLATVPGVDYGEQWLVLTVIYRYCRQYLPYFLPEYCLLHRKSSSITWVLREAISRREGNTDLQNMNCIKNYDNMQYSALNLTSAYLGHLPLLCQELRVWRRVLAVKGRGTVLSADTQTPGRADGK